MPAAFCGVYGHKPSYGLIPTRGHAPPGLDGAPIALAVVGPLARSAADLDLALGVLAGPEPHEAVGYALNLPPPRHGELADFRVLIVDSHPAVSTDSEIRGALGVLASRLDALGCPVAHASDLLPDLAGQHGVFLAMVGAAMSRGSPGGTTMNAHEWMNLQDAQTGLRRQWARLFEAFDVVVVPAFGTVAFPHDDEPDGQKRVLTIDGEATPYFSQIAWPGVALLPHLPATAAPIGFTRGGLPIGAQIVGPYLEDRTAITFAGLLAREFGGFQPPPSLT